MDITEWIYFVLLMVLFDFNPILSFSKIPNFFNFLTMSCRKVWRNFKKKKKRIIFNLFENTFQVEEKLKQLKNFI